MAHKDTPSPEPRDLSVLIRERELAERWSVSTRTLQRWRVEGFGPAWMWIGGSIRYRMADILAFEARHRQGGSER